MQHTHTHTHKHTHRLAAESALIDVVLQLNTCAQEMKRHVDSNVYKGPGKNYNNNKQKQIIIKIIITRMITL